MMRGRRPRWRWVTAGGGALLAAAALVCALTWNNIFDAMLATQMALTPTSLSYRKWAAPSVPIYLEIYMFNWTNPEQFPHEKPHFDELGPYRFREIRKHVNVTFHTHNATVGYRTMRTWHFDETSNGSLSDIVTTLDVIVASAIFRGRYWSFFRQKYLSLGLSLYNHKISVTKTAGEMLFEGYSDPLLDMAKLLPSSATGGAPLVDKFGWFYGRNNSIDTDGYVEVTSGVDTGLPGQILKWNHQDSLPFYEGKCSQMVGSAGEFLPRDLQPEAVLTMFMPDLCRTVHMHYQHEGHLHGLHYLKYAMTERSFDNSSLTSENSCFCNGECLWSGVMNVSACRFGSPSFLSLPHFLHGDPRLRENVQGMNPDPDKHSFYFAVEPKLGVPIDVGARFQFNVFIESSDYISIYEGVPTILFPIFWVQQKVTVSDDVISEIRMVRTLSDWGGVVCACFCLLFTTLALMATCCYTRSGYTKPADLLMEKPKDEAEMKLNPK